MPPDVARVFANSAIRALMSQREIRRRIAFQLSSEFYADLNVSVPLGHGLQCVIADPSHWHSFSEIFIEREYAHYLDLIPPPNRWLDIGCHAGFFSLFLIWWKLAAGNHDYQGLLVDADPRVASSVNKLIVSNSLSSRLRFVHGAIGPLDTNSIVFALGTVMDSKISDGGAPSTVAVPVVSSEQISSAFPPPYDLVKVDIEGAEVHFLEAYQSLLQQTEFLLLEWHDGRKRALEDQAAGLGFTTMLQSEDGDHGLFLLRRATP